MNIRSLLTFFGVLLIGVLPAVAQETSPAPSPSPSPAAADLQPAYFAGGCFWCMQYAFDRVKGVKKTVVGYTGGNAVAPSYEDVSSGETGHAESIEVLYDPKEVTYSQLLDVFWHNTDPTTVNRQFADAGTQYRTAIFYRNDEEKKAAQDSEAALVKSNKYEGKPIVTQLVPAGTFYPAEDYHQEYYKKNPGHFQAYEYGSGRAGYIKRTWPDADKK